ncbi:MAG: alkaline phosphatase family protein [Armatimonadaceae bacterium]
MVRFLLVFLTALVWINSDIRVAQAQESSAKTKKVLIIGIDGVRPDALQAAKTPNLKALAESGASSYEAQTGPITVSGPSWSSMLTGVWHAKHGVKDNSFNGERYAEYPHFFRRIKQANEKLATASIVHWSPINHWILSHADYGVTRGSDEAVAKEAARYLQAENPDVLFLHFDEVDGAGHGHGYHPTIREYMSAIERADAHVGIVLAGLRARKTFTSEDWLILVSTDHGGKDKGHGADIPECRTIFLIVNGSSAQPGTITPPPTTVDIPATAMAHLGIPVKPEWKWDGKPVGIR